MIFLIHTGSLSFKWEVCEFHPNSPAFIKVYTVYPGGKFWAPIPVFLPAGGLRTGVGKVEQTVGRSSFKSPILAPFLTPALHAINSEPALLLPRRLAPTKLPHRPLWNVDSSPLVSRCPLLLSFRNLLKSLICS